MVNEIKSALAHLALPEKAATFKRFFKAGPGEYAEGDQFLGVTVPDQRQVVKEYWNKTNLQDLGELLASPFHEHRHTALLMLVTRFEKTKSPAEREEVVRFYLNNLPHINNWDLVDNSCYKILGRYCYENGEDRILRELAETDNLWTQRIAIVSTMWHAKKGNSFDLLKELALKNLHHPHDLMHKANGWLLREMGEKDSSQLMDFLKQHYTKMPRTTLRYAIEKLDEDLRQLFLKGWI